MKWLVKRHIHRSGLNETQKGDGEMFLQSEKRGKLPPVFFATFFRMHFSRKESQPKVSPFQNPNREQKPGTIACRIAAVFFLESGSLCLSLTFLGETPCDISLYESQHLYLYLSLLVFELILGRGPQAFHFGQVAEFYKASMRINPTLCIHFQVMFAMCFYSP